MFFWYNSGIMAIGVISFYVFSYEKEKVYMNLCVLFFIFATIFFDSFLMRFKGPDVDLSFIFKNELNYFHFKFPRIVIVLFLYASFYKMKIDYHKTQQLIFRINEKLDNANKNLQLLNSDLENKVLDRTRQLNVQNKRIKELAFTNSHIIRTYVARIIGLVNITEEPDVSQEDLRYCYRKIKEDSIKLDDVTRKLSNELIPEE
jgi:hypothetical protein